MTKKRIAKTVLITAECALLASGIAGLWVGIIMANGIINSLSVHPY